MIDLEVDIDLKAVTQTFILELTTLAKADRAAAQRALDLIKVQMMIMIRMSMVVMIMVIVIVIMAILQ